MKKLLRNTITGLIALSLIAGSVPVLAIADENEPDDAAEAEVQAEAETVNDGNVSTDKKTSVTYRKYSWNAANQALSHSDITVDEPYIVVTSDLMKSNPDGLEDGTYVVNSDVTIEDYVFVGKGKEVDLIVLDGVTLTCKKGVGCGYNQSGESATLNIYGTGTGDDGIGTGKIVTTGKEKCAGIGGKDDESSGSITIHGTTIETTGGKHAAGIGGGEGGKDPDASSPVITIYNGKITATGGIDGAGIGGGDEQPGARTYIYGGTVTASSKKHGAGIGGGDEEGTFGIWIYGGKITASGGDHGAGIGAGEEGGNMRKESDGGGINILGGNVTATGGGRAAGIGSGYDEDLSGTIMIKGESTKLKVQGGSKAAGIGAGYNEDISKGDMNGDLTIDCGANSNIEIHGGSNWDDANGGAGIGGGCGGSLKGNVYIKGGKRIYIESGNGAAGIGGGREEKQIGGEGGDVYIGGGNIEIHLRCQDYKYGAPTKIVENEAIGAGDDDNVSGSVYIHHNNNKTGKYMRVYKLVRYDGDWHFAYPFKETALAGKRSNMCHSTRCDLFIQECPHKDHNNNNGLSYTYKDTEKHIKKCKYCDLNIEEDHVLNADGKCVCGYHTDAEPCVVTLKGEPANVQVKVWPGQTFTLPYEGGEIISSNTNPVSFSRVTGWRLGDAESGDFYEPGSDATVTSDMTFYLQKEPVYKIEPAATQNGSVTCDHEYAKAGESVGFEVEPDNGYRVSSVSYKYLILDGSDYVYSDDVPIDVNDEGKYRLIIPDDLPKTATEITVNAEFEHVGISNKLAGYKLSLDGDIGVNFFMELSDDVIEHKDTACMKFTIPNGASSHEEQVLVKDAKIEYVNNKPYYVFKCSVSAKDMNSDITAQLIDGEDEGTEYTYTVQSYAKYILDHKENPEYAKAVPLVIAMLNYGAYSQVYFGNNIEDLVNDILSPDEQVLDSDVSISHGDVFIENLPDGVAFAGASLSLKSELTLSLYFKNPGGAAVDFYYDNTRIVPEEFGDYLKVKITGINADQLSGDYTVKVDDGCVRYSPMNYCKAVLEGDYGDDLKNVVKALYAYSQAAEAYFKQM